MKPSQMMVVILAVISIVVANSSEATEKLPDGSLPAPNHNGIGYVPFNIDGAKLVPRIVHLQPQRDWERMDIYIPASAKPGDKLPCIVNVYGGGYGEKGVGTIKGIVKPLIDRGYVVACPDYALQIHAPETLASWDVANSIRHLRANASKYNIDPERIGLAGWSAGGWIAQFIGYAGPADIRPIEVPSKPGERDRGATPTVEPRPLYTGHPITLQAVVSDWSAGKLVYRKGDDVEPSETLSPDDPPLLTCFNGKPRAMPNTSVGFLQAMGIAAEPVFLGDAKSMHVPKLSTPGWNAKGEATTWQESICNFFDRTVKNPPRSSAPQIRVVPTVDASTNTTVELLSVHAIYSEGSVHYTLDGKEPTNASPTYKRHIELKPGQTIKAIAIKPGLPTSGVASFKAPTLPRPTITTGLSSLAVKVGETVRLDFQIDLPSGSDMNLKPTWVISGRIGGRYKPPQGGRPRTYPWMQIDRATGKLTGVPRMPGVYPIIVTAFVTTDSRGKLDQDQTAIDARLVVVIVKQ